MIIGVGYIGLEFVLMFNEYGFKVVVFDVYFEFFLCEDEDIV